MDFLNKEDYVEPRCPLCSPTDTKQRIPIMRVLEKLDEYLSFDDWEGAKRHLLYWLSEAESFDDFDGSLAVSNELVGLFRKIGDGTKSLSYSVKAIKIAKSLGLEDSVTMGTTLLNAATANNAFGNPKEAVDLYQKAQVLYEKYLDEKDTRLAGLYNNLALALVNVKEYERAEEYFKKALENLAKSTGNQPEEAVTYCNLADLKAEVLGIEKAMDTVNEYLSKAQQLLDDENARRDGNYAYVCTKCAPCFGYYGYFMYQEELEERAKKIYERA